MLEDSMEKLVVPIQFITFSPSFLSLKNKKAIVPFREG